MHRPDSWHFHRTWQKIIHEATAQQLTVGIVADLFVKGGANPLSDTAVDLSLHQEGVDELTRIVADDIVEKFDFPRVSINLDNRHVGRVGPGHRGRHKIESFLKAWFQSNGKLRCPSRHRRSRQLAQRDRSLRHSPDKNFSVTKFEIIPIGLQQVRGELEHLFSQPRRSFEQGGADVDGAAAAERAAAELNRCGITFDEANILWTHTP